MAALAGCGSWLVKQGLIAATLRPDGAPSENLAIAVFFLLGAVLLVVSASGLVARLTAGWHIGVLVGLAVVLSPMIFWAIFTGADAIVDTLAGPDAGWSWPSEGAIVVTAVIFGTAGAAVIAAGRRTCRSVPA